MASEMVVDGDDNVRRISDSCKTMNIEVLRKVIGDLMDQQEYKSAAFWAEKLTCLSSGFTRDVYVQAQCLYHLKEYHRAIHCIKTRNLHYTDVACRHLAAKCYVSLTTLLSAANVTFSLQPKNTRKLSRLLASTTTRMSRLTRIRR